MLLVHAVVEVAEWGHGRYGHCPSVRFCFRSSYKLDSHVQKLSVGLHCGIEVSRNHFATQGAGQAITRWFLATKGQRAVAFIRIFVVSKGEADGEYFDTSHSLFLFITIPTLKDANMASSPSRSVTKTRSDRRSRSRPRGRGRSPARHDSLSDIEGGVNTSHDDDTGLHHTLSRTPTGPSHMGSVSSAFDTSFGSHPRRRAAPVHQLAASLPSPGLYFPQAQTQSSDSSPVVPRESDYLADWETLQRLVVPSPRRADHGPSPASASSSSSGTPRMPSLGRLGSALGRPPLPRRDTREHSPVSIRSVTSPNRLFGRPATTPIEDVPEDDSEASVSGVALSSSPGNLDFMSSISQVAETDDDSGTRTVTQTPRPQQTQLEESYERFFAPITPGVSGFPSIPGTPSQPPPPAPSGTYRRCDRTVCFAFVCIADPCRDAKAAGVAAPALLAPDLQVLARIPYRVAVYVRACALRAPVDENRDGRAWARAQGPRVLCPHGGYDRRLRACLRK